MFDTPGTCNGWNQGMDRSLEPRAEFLRVVVHGTFCSFSRTVSEIKGEHPDSNKKAVGNIQSHKW